MNIYKFKRLRKIPNFYKGKTIHYYHMVDLFWYDKKWFKRISAEYKLTKTSLVLYHKYYQKCIIYYNKNIKNSYSYTKYLHPDNITTVSFKQYILI